MIDRDNFRLRMMPPRIECAAMLTPRPAASLVVIVLAFVVVTLLAVFAGTSTHSGYSPPH
jgi:hypothetical protein